MWVEKAVPLVSIPCFVSSDHTTLLNIDQHYAYKKAAGLKLDRLSEEKPDKCFREMLPAEALRCTPVNAAGNILNFLFVRDKFF